MAMHPVHFHWPDRRPSWNWRGLVAVLRPVALAVLVLPCLIWVAKRMAQALDDSALALAARPDLGHAVVSGVNVALIGIVFVIVLCATYGTAGWAIGALIRGVVGLWPTCPRSRWGWIAELAALAIVWGLLFHALHSTLLRPHVPSSIEPLLVWCGLPGLLYVWADVLRQGRVI